MQVCKADGDKFIIVWVTSSVFLTTLTIEPAPVTYMLKRFFSFAILLGLMWAAPLRAQFIISEFMADNVSSADVDEDGSHSDWLEIQNVGATTASLNGWYLTDDSTDLRKWQFPAVTPALNVASGGRLVVWCSNKNRKAVATKLHTNFKL